MEVPSFCKLSGEKVLFNQEGELRFYVPENYFSDVKQHPIAEIHGQYVTFVGVCDWSLVDKNGKEGKIMPFKFPSIFMCKPGSIEKVKGLKLNGTQARDYRIFHFKKGDEVISDINTPNIVDNVETTFGMMIISGNKMPNTIPYDHGHEYFPEAMELNGDDYGVGAQFFGILWSELCRDPKDTSRPFRLSDMSDMIGYKRISIKQAPNYVSPYVAFTNENLDESIMAAALMTDESKYKESPLEKVITR